VAFDEETPTPGSSDGPPGDKKLQAKGGVDDFEVEGTDVGYPVRSAPTDDTPEGEVESTDAEAQAEAELEARAQAVVEGRERAKAWARARRAVEAEPLPPPPGGVAKPGRTLTGELEQVDYRNLVKGQPPTTGGAAKTEPAAEDEPAAAQEKDDESETPVTDPLQRGISRKQGAPGSMEDVETPVFHPELDIRTPTPWDREELVVSTPVPRLDSSDFALEPTTQRGAESSEEEAMKEGGAKRDSVQVISEAVNMDSVDSLGSLKGEEAEKDFARRTTPRPGRDVIGGRYRISKRIGAGGMARIFKVVHEDLGKAFALKIIHTALSDDPRMRDMFFHEARMASAMEHPNIVQITDFGEDPDFGAFIVMEYLHGQTLRVRLFREERIHVNLACDIVAQVADALRLIHSRGVVHCDIKSDNIFLCRVAGKQRRRIQIKLLDFGLSRMQAASGPVSLSDVGGTPAYMAPERIRRAPPHPSMDIYSLGVLFYEMLTGTLPFKGEIEDVLMAHLKKEPEPPSARLPEPLDDRVDEIVLKALRKDPAKRQKDMGAFLYEVRTLMDMLGVGPRRWRARSPSRVRDSGVLNYQAVFERCPLPLFETDSKLVIVAANKAFAAFVGATVGELTSKALSETRLGQTCPDLLEDAARVLKRGRKKQRVMTFFQSSEKQVSTMVWLAPNRVRDRVVGLIGVIHPYKLP
jgi:serine/threonine-protein kinase